MKQLMVFMKKEFLEITRNGKLLILLIVFVLFGIMNPAIAKITPWMMEMLSSSLSEAGLAVSEVKVDALTSWMQFYKNVPLAMIIFFLLLSGIFTTEYQKGTLVNMVTRGLSRWKIVMAKTMVMVVLWTAGYWLCFGITYAYNAYFWDNSVAVHVGYAACGFYVTGLWLISLLSLTGTLLRTGSSVVVVCGGAALAVYLLGLLPDLSEYMPSRLWGCEALLTGGGGVSMYSWAFIVTAVLIVINLAAAVLVFNRKIL